MPGWRDSRWIVAHCLLAVFSLGVRADAQTGWSRYSGSNAQVLEFGGGQRLETPRRIAVVGDVERPGVYESTAGRIVAGTVLSAAGTLSAPGDYFCRYHAGLRPVIEPTGSSDSIEVLSGDVLVVTIPPTRRRPSATDTIHVAVIGLGPDPVVVRVGASERTLTGLLLSLNQRSSVGESALVNGAPATGLLENGDVVVVRPHEINRAAIIGCEAVMPVRSLDDFPEETKTAQAESTEASAATATLFPLQAPDPGELRSPDVASAEDDSPPTASLNPMEPIPSSERLARNDDQPRLMTAGVEEKAASRPSIGGSRRRQTVQSARRETDLRVDADWTIRGLVVLVALGTLGLGVSLLWLASERRRRPVAMMEPVDLAPAAEAGEPAHDALNELIQGRLAVEDEPVVLPSRISLHGSAVGQKRLIVHPPQSLAGPHFGIAGERAEPGARAVAAGVSAGPPIEAPQRASSAIRSAKDTEGLLDRVLLAMQREGRR